ncbi:GTP 3',8-cyclase MoaA [Ghiorsea bivora]|uniref:GTP 3',8-cyclase MoaA n=1 Tax=Ghiorsea bivora TaxID=1485545 RepID=UPI00056E59B6|nr:GTP 3',8-cyclase MoaA [Ghiorsea bivora]
MNAVPITFYAKAEHAQGLQDSFGRKLNYLRISVTDRCNMRCDYCRPSADAYQAEPRSHILSFEEITRIVRVAASLGVNKVRITGGEPLVRKDLSTLIAQIAAIDGITDLAMTSNATYLAKYAQALKDAGLSRINISLDTLNPLRFKKLTGSELQPVLDGIQAASDAGLFPLKLNTVLMKGINENEVPSLIDFATEIGATIRFIELMPMKQGMDWDKHYIGIDEILQRDDVQARVDISPMQTGNTAARYLPLKDGRGEVGFIMPMSERFCEGCNRLRLTSDGGLRSCLPADKQMNIRDVIRAGGSDADIRGVFLRSALIKPEIGIYEFDGKADKRSMIHIGG